MPTSPRFGLGSVRTRTRPLQPAQSDPAAILRWYALLERVYEQLDAVIAADGAPSLAPNWEALLAAATEHFQLEQLTLSAPPAPARTEPNVLTFPLTLLPALASLGPDDRPPQAAQPHLTARLKRETEASPLLRSQLSLFVNHVERCLQLQHRLETERRVLDRLHRCLDALPTATVLCDAEGRAVRVNRAADELAERVPELCLGPGLIRFAASEGKEVLAPLFARVRRSPRQAGDARWELTAGGLQFTLLALPLHGVDDSAPAYPGLGLVIQEQTARPFDAQLQLGRPPPSAPTHLRRRLKERFGLTDKEIQLAHALAMGLSIATYAEHCQRSPQTLRKQVKSIFSKIGVHDQKNLILRVWQEREAEWIECVKVLLEDHEPKTKARAPSAPTLRPEPEARR